MTNNINNKFNIFEKNGNLVKDFSKNLNPNSRNITKITDNLKSLTPNIEKVIAHANGVGGNKILVSKELKDASGNVLFAKGAEIKNFQDFEYAIKNGGLTPQTIKQIEIGLLKSGSLPANFIKDNVDSLINSKVFKDKYGKITSKKELIKQLQANGYHETSINEIMKQLETKTNFWGRLDINAKKTPTKKAPTKKPSGGGNGITSKLTDALISAGKIATGVKIVKFALLGAGAGLVAYLSNGTKIQLNSKYSEEVKNLLNPCLRPLLSNGGEIAIVSDGAQLILKKTGNPEDDSKGGIVYYPNGRVWTMDKSKKGSWSCDNIVEENLNETMKPKTLKEAIRFRLKNLLNEEIDKIQLAQDVDKMVDLLDMYSSAQDLKDAFDLLTKYSTETINGQNAGKVFLQKYRSAGLGGFVGLDTSVSDSVSKIIAINSVTKQYKEDLLNLVKNIESGKVGPKASGKSSNGVKVNWDKDSLTKTTTSTSTQPKQKMRYKLKNDFPYLYGDKSDVIKQIQRQIDLEPRYITGNFGPITLKRLTDMGFEMKNGITPGIYKQIMNLPNSQPSSGEVKPTNKIPYSNPDSPFKNDAVSRVNFNLNNKQNSVSGNTQTDSTSGKTEPNTTQIEGQPSEEMRNYIKDNTHQRPFGNVVYRGNILSDNEKKYLNKYVNEKYGKNGKYKFNMKNFGGNVPKGNEHFVFEREKNDTNK